MHIYGLVLEGGGTRGAYQMGAYMAVEEKGIKIKGVTGTSVGALNGAMIVQGDYEKACELWKNIHYSMIIKGNQEDIDRISDLKWDRQDLIFIKEKFKSLLSEGGLDIGPFRDFLEENIDERKIRNSGIDFGIVTVNLSDLKPLELFIEDIPEGQLKNYLIASSYLPIFKSERIDGKLYLDGAFYDNLPFRMLEEKGYKDLILVRTHSRGVVRKINYEKSNLIIVAPREDLGGILDWSLTRAKYNFQLGYYDGLKTLDKLKGEKYYIKSELDKDYFLEYLLSISKEEINSLQEILKLRKIEHKRSLFEDILPKLFSMISLDEESKYEDLIISLLEIKAEYLGVERFKIYPIKELLETVANRDIFFVKEEKTPIDRIIDKVDIISLFNKEETLLKVSNIIISKRKVEY